MQKRQIEPKQVVILNNIGVALADQRTQIGDQRCFVGGGGRFKNGRQPLCIAHGDQENTPALGTQRGRFKIELEAVEIGICEVAKVDPAGRHQVLLNWPDPVIVVLNIIQVFDWLAEPLCCAGADRPLQRAPITR